MERHLATRTVTTLALMLALIFVLSLFEGMLPPLPMNMRFGLSNVVTMYALFFLGKKPAFLLAAAKSLFVLSMRGPTAGLLSLSGGMLSLCVLVVLSYALHDASYLFLSVFGAIAHNLAQITAASYLTSTNLFTFYLPVMTVAGILTGCLTGTLLRVVMPVFGSGSIKKASVSRT